MFIETDPPRKPRKAPKKMRGTRCPRCYEQSVFSVLADWAKCRACGWSQAVAKA